MATKETTNFGGSNQDRGESNLAAVERKNSIYRRFNVVNGLYSAIIFLTVMVINYLVIEETCMRLVAQNTINQASLVEQAVAPLLNGQTDNSESIRRIFSLLAKQNEGTKYVVLQDIYGHNITAWFENNKPVPVEIITTQTEDNRQTFITKRNFVGVDKKDYVLQYSIDIYALFSPVTKLLLLSIMLLHILLAIYATIAYFVYKRMFIVPLITLAKRAFDITVNRNLKVELKSDSKDEYGQLYEILNSYNKKCRQLLVDIDGCCGSLTDINGVIESASRDVSNNSTEIIKDSANGAEIINNMLESFKNISERIKHLNAQTEDGSATVYQMAQVNKEVCENISAMDSSVTESIKAINQMSNSIQQNSENMEQLNRAIEVVSSAVMRLDDSIADEEKSARETSKLARELSKNADHGMNSIKQTIEGIKKIEASSINVFYTIQQLGEHTKNVGNILKVIEDITKQTNLLSLNAAIIAAQAGEHGRGFAVVAEQISELAGRTKESTKEIIDIISTIQDSTNESIKAIADDKKYIQEGVKLGEEAASSFSILQKSASESIEQSQKMAEATIGQASEIRSITNAIQGVAKTIQEINQSSHYQAQEAGAMNQLANRMVELNQQVSISSKEQIRSADNVMKVMEVISNTTIDVNRKQQEQQENAELAVNMVFNIENKANVQAQAVDNLKDTIMTINTQISQLSGYLGEYKY